MMKTTNNLRKQVATLETMARNNEKLGNDVLAYWMKQSALYFQDVVEKTNKALDDMERTRNTDNTGNYRMNSKRDFYSAWYEYEDILIEDYGELNWTRC